MLRTTLVKITAAVCAIACLSSRLEAAEDPNMQTAMNAIFGKTGEKKELRVRGHEFNVKPAKITAKDGKVTITGRISHCLRFRDDDQVDYTIEKENGKVVKIDVKVDGSFLQGIVRSIGKLLKDEVAKQISGSDENKEGKDGTKARLKPAEELESMESVLAKITKLSGSGWEGAVKEIIANVAVRADSQGQDRLVQLRRMVNRGGVPASGTTKGAAKKKR